MEHRAQHVRRAGRPRGRVRQKKGKEASGRRVGAHDVPAAVHHHRRIRLLVRQDQVHRPAERLDRRRLEAGLGIKRSKPRRHQKVVALAVRHAQHRRQIQDHLPARPRPAGLEEAQVARRNLGVEREVELALPARPAPALDQQAEGGLIVSGNLGSGNHDSSLTSRRAPAFDYLGGKASESRGLKDRCRSRADVLEANEADRSISNPVFAPSAGVDHQSWFGA